MSGRRRPEGVSRLRSMGEGNTWLTRWACRGEGGGRGLVGYLFNKSPRVATPRVQEEDDPDAWIRGQWGQQGRSGLRFAPHGQDGASGNICRGECGCGERLKDR